MSFYSPIHTHTTYSFQALPKPWEIARRAREIGAKSIAVTDYGSLSALPALMDSCKNACKWCGYSPEKHFDNGKGKCSVRGVDCNGYEKDPIKPILGCELYLCPRDASIKDQTNDKHTYVTVLSKNKDGWRNLMKLISKSNSPEFFHKKPRLDLNRLKEFSSNLIAFSGHPNSDFFNVFFKDVDKANNAKSYESAKALVKPWNILKNELVNLANKYIDIFGKDNFYLSIQLIDKENFPASEVVANGLRWLAKELNIKKVAVTNSQYCRKVDAIDQRLILCSIMDTTFAEIDKELLLDKEGFGKFFKSNNYHIPTYEELKAIHEDDELENTNLIADSIESFDIFNKPRLPNFDCPNNASPAEYIKELWEAGWKEKVEKRVDPSKYQVYRERLELETKELGEAGLFPYFLIVADICKYSQKELGCKKARGRGSASGCLLSYLLDITDTDPIKYELSYERFYCAARNDAKAGRFSLPDIDMDFPSGKRDLIFEYIRKKYGEDKAVQMVTYNRLQGRGVIATVLKTHGYGTYEERKKITAAIPDESKITDDLQEMMEEFGEASIVMWALENNADFVIDRDSKQTLKDLVCLNEDGTITGPLAKYFEQAIRIEGAKKAQSKHAAGIIISAIPLADECPLLYDKSNGKQVAGFEMGWLEKMGFLKFDCLATTILDKIQGAVRTLLTGEVGDESDDD